MAEIILKYGRDYFKSRREGPETPRKSPRRGIETNSECAIAAALGCKGIYSVAIGTSDNPNS
jgi:hypothetical protein